MTTARIAIKLLLPIVKKHRQSLIECHSQLVKDGKGGTRVMPGTIDPPEVAAEAARMQRAIDAGEAFLKGEPALTRGQFSKIKAAGYDVTHLRPGMLLPADRILFDGRGKRIRIEGPKL